MKTNRRVVGSGTLLAVLTLATAAWADEAAAVKAIEAS